MVNSNHKGFKGPTNHKHQPLMVYMHSKKQYSQKGLHALQMLSISHKAFISIAISKQHPQRVCKHQQVIATNNLQALQMIGGNYRRFTSGYGFFLGLQKTIVVTRWQLQHDNRQTKNRSYFHVFPFFLLFHFYLATFSLLVIRLSNPTILQQLNNLG